MSKTLTLDDDDGSEENPNKTLDGTLTFIDPSKVDSFIAAFQTEALAQGFASDKVNTAIGIIKTLVPAVAGIAAPGSGPLVAAVMNAIPNSI